MLDVKFILGIDWGANKIGLAIADSHNNLATPLKTVKNLEEVLAVIKAEHIEVLVVGKPVTLSGKVDKFTNGFSSFVAKLARATGQDINYVDERLTSKAAQKMQLPAGKKEKVREDAVAAMLILQSWLDHASV